MREGRHRRELEAAVQAMFSEDIEHRVLPFDMSAATAYAEIFAAQRRMGVRRPEPSV
jgi:toxin FitB